MKTSTSICGFWFHIKWIGNEGVDQNGNHWTNPKNPKPINQDIINDCLDGYNQIINQSK